MRAPGTGRLPASSTTRPRTSTPRGNRKSTLNFDEPAGHATLLYVARNGVPDAPPAVTPRVWPGYGLATKWPAASVLTRTLPRNAGPPDWYDVTTTVALASGCPSSLARTVPSRNRGA